MNTMMAAGAAQMQDATIAIRPSKLWIEAGALRVVWEDNDDLGRVSQSA